MLICTLDGNNITDRDMLHDILSDSLRLPDWYGRNLDALYDCLTEIQEETEIRILHKETLEDHLGRHAMAVTKVLKEACGENPRIHFREDSEMPGTDNFPDSYRKPLTACQKTDTNKEYRHMNLSNITINTQNSIRIEGSKILYFDPFQVEDSCQDADLVFITHEHYDHFDPDSIAKVKKDDTILIAPESMKKKALSKSGIAAGKCVFYSPGETDEQGGVAIQTVPAYNKLKPFHPKMKKWLGYVVKMDDIRYYVAGDTDVNEDIRKVQCDVALIPIGGYYTMDRKQAAEYVTELKPVAVIPTHYGSIIGSKTDGQDLTAALKSMASDIQVELKLY